ncbi:MATE family efflux transporter [Catenovulum sediminis]|uniref:MATE family efflux transporter n=1 Tax=Catenovulum sediminis TaxID=1740262 RepID=UPI00163DA402|nr:MATE family efflux transporter [Catenovulum sediminis]
MIISNITTPLLGIVDTAILGHLSGAHLLAGVAIASTLITALVWLFGFLRMSITGMTSQALANTQAPKDAATQLFVQGAFIALLTSFIFLLLSPAYLKIGLWFADTTTETIKSASDYFNIRIFSLPASLLNLVLVGWLLAHGHAKQIMWIQILINLMNVVLDLVTVYLLQMGVKGVAVASLIAEYTGLIGYLYFAYPKLKLSALANWPKFLKLSAYKPFLRVNRDILLRTLMLEISFVFLTMQGARIGVNYVAVNAVLMNFLLLISLGLDGIAYAAEVLVGKQYGGKNYSALKSTIRNCLNLSLLLAFLYTLIFALFGQSIIYLMTDIEVIRVLAADYIIYIILLPLTAVWCFLYDGVFIGLADSKSMRNSMAMAVFGVFFPVWYVSQSLGNHALWLALHAMMIARGVSLWWKIPVYTQPGVGVNDKND